MKQQQSKKLEILISTSGDMKIIEEGEPEIEISVDMLDYMIGLYKHWQKSEFNENGMPEIPFDGRTYPFNK